MTRTRTDYKVRNYTSTVPVSRTVAAIEEMLGKAGASHIGKTYAEGEVVGFAFQLTVDGGHSVLFKLPCRWEAVEDLLTPRTLKSYQRSYPTRKRAIQDQARRTAWRLMHDWIAVQIAMIQLGQAEAMQVFLPYAWDEARDRTFFDVVKGSGFAQLPAPGGNRAQER